MAAAVPNPSLASVPADSLAFFEGLDDGCFLTQTCTTCDRPRFYPRLICPECGSPDSKWIEGGVEGAVHSFTSVQRATYSSGPLPPYQVVWAELDSGARFIAVADAAEPLAIGERIRVVVMKVGDRSVPTFRRAEDGAGPSFLAWTDPDAQSTHLRAARTPSADVPHA